MKIPTVRVSEYVAQSPESQMRTAMQEKGFSVPAEIILDGLIHRYGETGRKDDDALWYVGFTSPVVAGAFGDWRTGVKYSWSGQTTSLSQMERDELQMKLEEAKAQAEADRQRRAEDAAIRAQKIWASSQLCMGHPYLTKKAITSPCGTKVDSLGNLVVPIINDRGQISSVEMISADGRKKFLPGGAVKGGWFIAGSGDGQAPDFVAEGFATAVSIYEATGRPCLIAFSAGNLTSAIQSYRTLNPQIKALTIVADNDESHAGEIEAYKAKEATGCEVVLIPTLGMDANDYATSGANLKTLLIPQKSYLEPVDSYLKQIQPKHWLIKGWMPAGSTLMMVFGQSGHGKTFFILDMMLHIATGQSLWCGHKVTQGNVVYLCGEGQQGIRERVAAWAQDKGLTSLGDRMYISQGASLLDTSDGFAKVRQAIAESSLKPDLIVIDTLNRFMAGDENDTRDASAFIAMCDRLESEYNAVVCIVHHVGVSDAAKNRARGSSAFLGALDVQIQVSKSGDLHTATMTKNKDGKEEAPVNFHLKDVQLTGWIDEDGETESSAVMDPTDDKPATRIPKQQKTDEDMLLDAVATVGGLSSSGGVQILRDKWISFLVDRGRDKKAAQRDLSEGQERKLVSRLISYGDLLSVPGGWMVVGQLADIARMDVNGKLFREA
ncbi:MAG: AAA family ATPase [Sphaerochaetaceae bacterium]